MFVHFIMKIGNHNKIHLLALKIYWIIKAEVLTLQC